MWKSIRQHGLYFQFSNAFCSGKKTTDFLPAIEASRCDSPRNHRRHESTDMGSREAANGSTWTQVMAEYA
ncbi:hypothetical protein [Paraburkholderia aspalathi]|uniref:hypothetical protein n=1 Tax=Paraburkholderia aspalathi TaxID=1324617 RepID=UPI0038BD2287